MDKDLEYPYIPITKEEYYRLTEDAKLLDALQATGVSSWEGYETALEIARAFN